MWSLSSLLSTCTETCFIGCPQQSLKGADPQTLGFPPPASHFPILPPSPTPTPTGTQSPGRLVLGSEFTRSPTRVSLNTKLSDEDTAARWGWTLRLIDFTTAGKSRSAVLLSPVHSENTEVMRLPQAGTAQLEWAFQILTLYSRILCYTCLYRRVFFFKFIFNKWTQIRRDPLGQAQDLCFAPPPPPPDIEPAK